MDTNMICQMWLGMNQEIKTNRQFAAAGEVFCFALRLDFVTNIFQSMIL